MHTTARRSAQFGIAILLILCLLSSPLPISAGNSADYVADEIIVSVSDAEYLDQVIREYDLDPQPLDHFGANQIYLLRILDGSDPEKLAKKIKKERYVEYAEANYYDGIPMGMQRSSWAKAADESDYAEQWAADTIGLRAAHSVTRGAGVTVAVLDTGIDLNHELFQGRLVPGYDFVDLDNDPSEVLPLDEYGFYGHGTHVAGVIAMVAPESKIMPVRVLDEYGMGNVWVLARALQFAVDPDGNPETDDGADVINLSLGTTQETKLLKEIVESINCSPNEVVEAKKKDKKPKCDRGVVVIVAAGNTGEESESFPAAEAPKAKGALAVAASTHDDELAAFSSRGSWIKIMAPGEDIVSSLPGGGYGAWSGTSMATPLVTGSAALLRAAYPDLKADKLIKHLIKSAVKIKGKAPDRLDTMTALLDEP
jgi:subtilisin family serine protease